jgi:hypothetical protein
MFPFAEPQPPPKPTHFFPLRLPWYPAAPPPAAAAQPPFEQLTYAPKRRWWPFHSDGAYQPFGVGSKASIDRHVTLVIVLMVILLVALTLIVIVIVQATGLYNFAAAASWLSWLSVLSPSSSSGTNTPSYSSTAGGHGYNSYGSSSSSSSSELTLPPPTDVQPPANIPPLAVYSLNSVPGTLSLQMVNATINALNSGGSFDYWPRSKYYGVGMLNTPAGAFCLAFKGNFIGFQTGFDYSRTFLGHPSIYYWFQGTCPKCPGSCNAAALFNVPGPPQCLVEGADKSMHQLQGTTCSIYGGSGVAAGSQLSNMTGGPFWVGIAFYVAAAEWTTDPNGGGAAIFEFYPPIFLIEIQNGNLSVVNVQIVTGGHGEINIPVPFGSDQWNFLVFGMHNLPGSANILSTFNLSVVRPNAQTDSWTVNPVVEDYVRYRGNIAPAKSVSCDFGIYRGKQNSSQRIQVGQVNIGYTQQSVMPQTTALTQLPTVLFRYSAQYFSQAGPLTSWSDLSGNGATALTVTPGSSPVVDLQGLGGRYPAVRFGASTPMSIPALMPVGQDFSVVAVVQIGASDVFSPLIGQPAANKWAFGLQKDTPGFSWDGKWRAPGLSIVPRDTPIILTMVYTAVNSSTTFYLVGADVGSGMDQTGRRQDALWLGCTRANCWNGTIAFIAMYAYALSLTERQAIELPLAAQYGMQYPYQISATQPVASPTVLPADGVTTTTISFTVLAPLTNKVLGGVLVGLNPVRGAVDSVVPAYVLVGSNGQASFTATSTLPGVAPFTPVLLEGGDFVFEYSASVQFTGFLVHYSALNVSDAYLGSGEYYDFVSVWQDSTGNGNDATSANQCDYYSYSSYDCTYPYEGSPPPVYSPNGMNGYPTLQFFESDPYYMYDGVNASTLLTMPSLWPVGTSFTCILLVIPSADASGGMSVLGNTQENGAVTLRLTSNHEIEFFLAYYTGGGAGLTTSTYYQWGQPLLITLQYWFAAPKANLSITVNGVQAAFKLVSSPNTKGVQKPDAQLGCDDSGSCYTGGVSEVLLWNEWLTPEQLQEQWDRINSAYDL